MQIHATARPRDDDNGERREWTITTHDQGTGMAEIEAAIPEGWVLLQVRVDRDA